MYYFKINKKEDYYPLNLELFQEPFNINLEDNIVFLAGDNGSGKSTILDMIAFNAKAHRISFEQSYKAVDFKNQEKASKNVTLRVPFFKNKYYFRAEDFILYINFLHQEKADSYKELERVKAEYKNKSQFSKQQAASPFLKTIGEIDSMYTKDLLEQSHGQSYLDFFTSRLKENTLFIIDEPESALSFNSLLIFLSLLKQYKDKNCKFIISTHSPILLALPEAIIYEINDSKIKEVKYDDLEQIKNLKSFLNHPNAYLKYL